MSSRDYPDRPMLGVSVLVRRDSDTSVLLVKRGREPLAGLWSLPGGLVNAGERLVAAAVREVREETGVSIGDIAALDLEEVIAHDGNGRARSHYVVAVFAARYADGEVSAADDAADAAWVSPHNPDGLALTEGTAKRLAAEARA